MVHNSDLEQLVGNHSPRNSCYSFYKENGGKLGTEVGLRVICITWTMNRVFFPVNCTLDSLKSGTV